MSFSSKTLILLIVAALTSTATAKVYEDIPVAKYKASFSLENAKGQTFLKFMQNTLFMAISNEGPKQKSFEIAGVQNGEGVELRLSPNVSTLHVGYKSHFADKAERSGRSFSAVGYPPVQFGAPWQKPVVKYVADASYSHYLGALERYLKYADEHKIRLFYKSLFEIILNSDSSSVESIDIEGQQVLADFVAVYIAEQYRRMTKGDGEGSLGYSPNWDDAHLQVTLIAAFHSGQSSKLKAMFYEGEFTKEIFKQINKVNGVNYCVYKQKFAPIRKTLKKQAPKLKDYTQFNKECARSGVNMTRRDFTALGSAITSYLKANKETKPLQAAIDKAFGAKTGRNVFDYVADNIIDNDAPEKFEPGQAEKIIDSLTNFILASRNHANKITIDLLDEESNPNLSEVGDQD